MKKNTRNVLSGSATILLTSLAAVPVLSADENPFHSIEVERYADSNQKVAQGMCGGRCGGNWEGRCGGMMPSFPDSSELPEPNSAGAKLVTQYCIQCHASPSPKQHSASNWPSVVERMNMRMQWMSQNNSSMNIKAPTNEELRTIIAYLQDHAMEPVNPED